MISAKNKRKLLQIIPFGLISMASGLMFTIIEKGVLGNHPVYPSTGNPFNFTPIATAIFSLLAGFFIGTLEITLLNRIFEKRSFLKKIAFKTVVYLFLIVCITLLISVIGHAIEQNRSPFDQEVLSFGLNFLNNFAFLSVVLFVSLGTGFCLFYTEISNNIGQSVLLNFFTGKYHRPKEEERIFMFLDMKDSTAIAEKLGHVKYFEMLKEYYADLTEPIINYSGEIYQYVGDEVVVSWKLDKGIHNNNCIQCFFAMKAALKSQAEAYQKTYELAPTFKAGMHLGSVTTGEIGVIKKDIVFTGDVLNTTARIQGLCNNYQVDLLVSEQLKHALTNESQWEYKAIGEAELRGRNEKVNLFTINSIK